MTNKTKDQIKELRLKVLTSACAVIEQQGIDKTCISSIARHAGVSRSSIYAQFDGRIGLMCALCHFLAQKTSIYRLLEQASAPTEPDPLGKLEQVLRMFACPDNHDIAGQGAWRILLYLQSCAQVSNSVALNQACAELIASRQHQLLRVLYNAVNKGQLPPSFDPAWGASIIASCLTANLNNTLVGAPAEPVLQHPHAAARLIALLKAMP